MIEYILKIMVNGNVLYINKTYNKEIKDFNDSINLTKDVYNREDIIQKEDNKCKEV